MSSLMCAKAGCERMAMRERQGQRWCMWHPEAEPPVFDAKGKLVGAQATKVVASSTSRLSVRAQHAEPTTMPLRLVPEVLPAATAEADPARDVLDADPEGLRALQAELDVLEQTDPLIGDAATAYDATVSELLAPERPFEDCEPTNDQHTEQRVVLVPPPLVEERLSELEQALERLLDEVATVRAGVRDVRIAYLTPAPEPETPAKPERRKRQYSPEALLRMQENGRRTQEKLRKARELAAAPVSADSETANPGSGTADAETGTAG